jgi:hypothetical protein
MSYNIGVVAEGFRDFDVIEEVLTLFVDDFRCLPLQPNAIKCKENGNGWEGVWRWCLEFNQNYQEDLNVQTPKLDALIIQLDGDTTREKKMFCDRPQECDKSKVDSAVLCRIAKEECAVCISDEFKRSSINDKYDFLYAKVLSWLSVADDGLPKIICLPFDCTESWIIAAFDGDIFGSPIEEIEKPGDTIIAQKTKYHDSKVPREGQNKLKKNAIFYETVLIPKLISEWVSVTTLCSTAKKFENEIRNTLMSSGT